MNMCVIMTATGMRKKESNTGAVHMHGGYKDSEGVESNRLQGLTFGVWD